jgi:hypothetical protein
VVSPKDMTGLNLSVGFVGTPKEKDFILIRFHDPFDEDEEGRLQGIHVAGLRVLAPEITGLAVGGLLVNSRDFTGLSIAAVNTVWGRQTGVSIGLFNYAESLEGVQIGILNHVPTNPPALRWLPLLNARF